MEPTKPTITAAEMHTAEQVLQLYREPYFDYKVRYFHEKLVGQHGIRLSYIWVKAALQRAGLIQKRGRRGTRRRPRAGLPGMLLHIDAGKQAWFQNGRYYDPITIPDDANQ